MNDRITISDVADIFKKKAAARGLEGFRKNFYVFISVFFWFPIAQLLMLSVYIRLICMLVRDIFSKKDS